MELLHALWNLACNPLVTCVILYKIADVYIKKAT